MTATRSYVMLLVLSLGLCGCGDEAKPDDGTKQSNGGSEAAPSPSTATGGSEEIGEDQPPTSAGSTDPAQPKTPEPVQVPDLPPLVFDPPLPTTPVAHVNDKPVPAGQLLEFVLMQNFSAGVQNLILGKIADRELEKSSIVVDEEAIKLFCKAASDSGAVLIILAAGFPCKGLSRSRGKKRLQRSQRAYTHKILLKLKPIKNNSIILSD